MKGELAKKGILSQHGQIYILRTSMPFPLRESNAFIAESDQGWTVIDAGVNLKDNRQRWEMAIKDIGISFKHITNIYLSHYHHDHMGLAGWLQQKSDADVWLPEEDLETFQIFISTDSYQQAIRETCIREGWDDDLVNKLAFDVHSIDSLITPYASLTPYSSDQVFYLGENPFKAMPVPGHTDGHQVLFSEASGVLFSGDNVVSHTILHLTDWPHTRLVDPLSAHLEALQRIHDLSIHLVLPGHGPSFANLAERIDLIDQHHQKRKNQVFQGLNYPTSAWSLACQVFKDNPYIHIKRLILAETLAYLRTLVKEQLVLVEDRNGVNYYRKAPGLQA